MPKKHYSGGRLVRMGAMVLLLTHLAVCGCKKPAPPPDLSKAPWLDPKVQLESLKSDDFRIRGVAAYNLGNIGANAADALPELERLAKDDANEKVRQRAQEAVDKIRAATGKPGQ
jgi:hypothetical protein